MRLGLSWMDTATVVVSTVGVYVGFLVLIRVVGQRALANMSSFDFAAAVALGAVMGRAVLGYTPTLLAALIGMTTLFALQGLFGLMRRNRRVDHALTNLPLLLMVEGRVLHDHLRRAHIVEDELRQKLRLAGVHRYSDVAAVILERTGAVSILRRGETIAAELVGDVEGRELLTQRLSVE
jgi:uncharacterized membrane protein YcaP (DUF421 family)